MPRISVKIFKLFESSVERLETIGPGVPLGAGEDAVGGLTRSRTIEGACVGEMSDADAAVWATTLGEARAKELVSAFSSTTVPLSGVAVTTAADGPVLDLAAGRGASSGSGDGSNPASINVAAILAEVLCATPTFFATEGDGAVWVSADFFAEFLLPDANAAVFSVDAMAAFLANDGEGAGESSSSMIMAVAFPFGPMIGVAGVLATDAFFSPALAVIGLGEAVSALGVSLALLWEAEEGCGEDTGLCVASSGRFPSLMLLTGAGGRPKVPVKPYGYSGEVSKYPILQSGLSGAHDVRVMPASMCAKCT